jgi:hypothetical protein
MPVLFETGMGDNTSIWNGITQPLADITGAPIIAYDRQGFGKSTRDPNRKGIEDEIKGLETALTKLGFTKDIMLVSHSYGGLYNTLFAIRNPEKVKGIVFIDATKMCIINDDMIKSMASDPVSMEMITTMKKQPSLQVKIPVIDIISEQNATRDNRWKTCHDDFIAESPNNRKGIFAYKTSHYIFKDNSKLVINAIVSLYSDLQKPSDKAMILEKAYAYELTSSNDDYKKTVEFQHSENDLAAWGKSLLQKNDAVNALEVMKLNTFLNPGSATAYDALGEAYLKTGNKELALANYKKTLELKPDSRNAKTAMDQINRITNVSESVLASYIGEYELNKIPVSVTKEGEKLVLNFNNTRSVMYFTSDTDFFIVEYKVDFKFFKDPEGNVQGFNLMGGMKASKVK